jgi:hypothetical protein
MKLLIVILKLGNMRNAYKSFVVKPRWRVNVDGRIILKLFLDQPASYRMGTGLLSPGLKWPGREAVYYLHLAPRLRTRRAIPPHLQYIFLA